MPEAATISVAVHGVSPTPTYLERLATNSLIAGAPSAAWWSKQAADVQFRFAAEVRAGLAANESVGQIVARVRRIMDVTARNAQALVRTSVQQVAADARRETFQRNRDVIAGIRHVSHFDSRTCWSQETPILMADGTQKPIGEIVVGDYVIGGVSGDPCRVRAIRKTTESSSLLIRLIPYNSGVETIVGRTMYGHRALTLSGWQRIGDLCLSLDVSKRQVLCRRITGPGEAFTWAHQRFAERITARIEKRVAQIRRAALKGFSRDGFVCRSLRIGERLYRTIENKVSARLQHDGWGRRYCWAVVGGEARDWAQERRALERTTVSQGSACARESGGAENIDGQQSFLRNGSWQGINASPSRVRLAQAYNGSKPQTHNATEIAQDEARDEAQLAEPGVSRESQRGARGEASMAARERSGMVGAQVCEDVCNDAKDSRRSENQKEMVAQPQSNTLDRGTSRTTIAEDGSGMALARKSRGVIGTYQSVERRWEDEVDGRASQEVGGANARALGRSAVQVESGCITGEEQEGEVEIVSLSVEGDHSYVAGGIIVHNSDICIAYGSDSEDGGGAQYDLDYSPINGTKLPYVNEGHAGVPRHWGCRSTEVAFTKSWTELGYPELEEGYPEFKPPKSGEEWLRAQGEGMQNELLGERRAAMWRAGKMTLPQLLNGQGEPLTVAELRVKYGMPTVVEKAQLAVKKAVSAYEAARDAAGKWVAETARKNGNREVARIYREDGTPIMEKVGEAHSIQWNNWELIGWRDANLMHYHPIDKSLSNGDLNVHEHTDLRRTQAVSAFGSFYEVDYGKQSTAFADTGLSPKWVHEGVYRELGELLGRMRLREIGSDYRANYYTPGYKIAPEEIETRAINLTMQHLANVVTARFGGFGYTANLSPFAAQQRDIAIEALARELNVANTEAAVVDAIARISLEHAKYTNLSLLLPVIAK